MDIPSQIITQNAGETQDFGKTLADYIIKQNNRQIRPILVCLTGDLGSGKTVFSQGFARGLGIDSRILSPTFIILRQYQVPGKNCLFYHLDLYRARTESIQKNLGLAEIFCDPDHIIIIEWAQYLRIPKPKSRIELQFRVISDNQRQINIQKYE